jgi:methyltransferase (TIGR00027 family)
MGGGGAAQPVQPHVTVGLPDRTDRARPGPTGGDLAGLGRRPPSRTARTVAIARAVGVRGIRDPLVAQLLPRRDRGVVRMLRTLPEFGPATGLAAHAGLRMQAVDRVLVEAIEAVAARRADGGSASPVVVVVGAGFDTRAWRLPELAGCRVVELDREATQVAKRARLAALPPPLAEVTLQVADLGTDDLDEVLDRAGQDPATPLVWVWEAVVPYLPPAIVDATLAVLARRSPPGSRLVVTTMRPALVAPSVPVVSLGARGLLRLVGEPIRTAESDDAFTARMARHGWHGSGAGGPRSWADDAGITVWGPLLDERLHVAARVSGGAGTG